MIFKNFECPLNSVYYLHKHKVYYGEAQVERN